MAYKDMKDSQYYTSTILLFILEATCAILIQDVTTVFGLLGAVAVTCLGFFFPGLFYIFSERRFGRQSSAVSKRVLNYRYSLAWVHVVIGVVATVVCLYSSIYGIINPDAATSH